MIISTKKYTLLSIIFFATTLSSHSCNAMGLFKSVTDDIAPLTKTVGCVFLSTLGYELTHNLISAQISPTLYNNSKFINPLHQTACVMQRANILFPIISIAAAARIGSWPQLEVTDLVKPALYTLGIITLLSSFAGIHRYANCNYRNELKNQTNIKNRTIMEKLGEHNYKKLAAVSFAKKCTYMYYWLAGTALPLSLCIMRYKQS